MVYSIDNLESFKKLKSLHNQMLRVKDEASFPVVIVGNKSDLEELRDVQFSDGQSFARSINAPFIEVSILKWSFWRSRSERILVLAFLNLDLTIFFRPQPRTESTFLSLIASLCDKLTNGMLPNNAKRTLVAKRNKRNRALVADASFFKRLGTVIVLLLSSVLTSRLGVI